jgi:hypothetical protein
MQTGDGILQKAERKKQNASHCDMKGLLLFQKTN